MGSTTARENASAVRLEDIDIERRSIYIWGSRPSMTGELSEVLREVVMTTT